MKIIVLLIISYIIGSIPFSFIVGRFHGNVDIRKHGSGNSGATNVYRVLGKKAGLIAFIGDFLKGLTMALITKEFLGLEMALLCSFVTVLGHCYPFTLNFKGGKGVATAGGTIFGFYPLVGIILVLSLILIIFLFRMMSLASISVAILLPLLAYLFNTPKSFIIYSILLGIFVVYKHKSNIKRLINGTESKIFTKK